MPRIKGPVTPISSQLRAQLLGAGESLYSIAAQAGVPRSCVSDFLRGRRGLTLDTLDRLAGPLGLSLVQSRRRPRKEKAGAR